MSLMVEKESGEEYIMKYIDMQQQLINTWKNITKKYDNQILCIWIQIIYIDGQCLKNYL